MLGFKILKMNERVNDKIIEIEKFLEELETTFPLDFETYKRNWKIKDIFERHFEKIIEAVVDIAFLIIKQKNLGLPKDDQSSFDILSNHNIISKELSENLKDAKGMRNIIIHEYGKVDDKLVFGAVTEQLEKDVREFIQKIEENLKTAIT